ncbi:MAG: hypothetical protein WBN81_05075 [Gammaproteobacteria bacterium]
MLKTGTEHPVTGCQPIFPGLLAALAVLMLSGCASKPLMPYTTDTTPMVLVPAVQSSEQDKRGRFREIFCTVLETRADSVPDYRSCEQALTTVGNEPSGSGKPVDLGQSKRRLLTVIVPGLGWDCFSDWLDMRHTVAEHIDQFGYDMVILDVDGLSSSTNNARQIRDAIMAMPRESTAPELILVGYSKGAADILEAVVNYPEIQERIAAVVSAAGAVGGTPLANDADQSQLNLLQYFPQSECEPGDGGALESLRPATRKAWLAEHTLPDGIAYYSLMAFPEPERISSVLRSSYRKLGKVDARNDSQLIFYDQFIPGSTLVAYLNADHWAVAVPIARAHSTLGSTFVNRNDYPREALFEALLRFIEEDLQETPRGNPNSY